MLKIFNDKFLLNLTKKFYYSRKGLLILTQNESKNCFFSTNGNKTFCLNSIGVLWNILV